MTTVDLLTACLEAGITLFAEGEQLTYEAPVGALTPNLRDALRARKTDLLPVLTRLAAMKVHGIDLAGGLAHPPVAMAKWPHHGAMGVCCSCGDALTHQDAYGRCDACQTAAEAYYRERNSQGDGTAV